MYEPYGFVQSHPNIKYVTSISDLISKVIDIELGDYTRVQVKPEGWGQIAGATPAPVVPMAVELDPDDEPVASEEELSRLCRSEGAGARGRDRHRQQRWITIPSHL